MVLDEPGLEEAVTLGQRVTLLLTLALVSGFLSFSSPMQSAQATGHHELLDTHELNGVGWVAWRLQVEEPDSLILWGFDGVYSNSTRAHWQHMFNGPNLTSGNYRNPGNVDRQVHAQALDLEIQDQCECREYDLRRDYWGLWEPGEYVLTALVATDGAFVGNISVHADPGVRILEKTAGDEVFSFSERELESAASVVYRARGEHHPTHNGLMAAKATLAGAKSVQIDNEMWGYMKVVGTDVSVCTPSPLPRACTPGTGRFIYHAEWEGPNGQGDESPVPAPYFWSSHLLRLEPGEYTFRFDYELAATYSGPSPQLFVVAADIVTP